MPSFDEPIEIGAIERFAKRPTLLLDQNLESKIHGFITAAWRRILARM